MTSPLRELHRRIIGLFTWLLPAMLLFGIAGYRSPVYTEIPDPQWLSPPASAELEQSVETEGEQDAERSVSMRIEIYKASTAGGAGAGQRWVRLKTISALRQPDLLVYWSPKRSTFDEPPSGAFLLGVFDPRLPRAFRLPPQADYLQGYLLVYSLGQRVLITQALLPNPV